MKKIFISVLSLVFAVSSCSDDDSYDWSSYEPVVQDLSGPEVGYASGLAPLTYTVSARGGATYEWSVEGIGAQIEPFSSSEDGSGANITFDQSNDDVEVLVKVVETTAQGVSSEVAVLPVSLKKFKPRTIDEFVGTWTTYDAVIGTEDPFEYEVQIEKAGDTQLTIKAVEIDGLNYSCLYTGKYYGWAENIVAGHGGDGAVTINLDLQTGAVTMDYQKMGLTTWGTYWYEVTAGVWDGFTMSIDMDVLWYYAEGDLDEAEGFTYGSDNASFPTKLVKKVD
ncbi:MAG: hypothetical protein ABFS32_16130 [Bacteroidota bacterium]